MASVRTQTDSKAPCPYNATGVVPPVQQLPAWDSLGCYHDDNYDRILNKTAYFGPENNTVNGCAIFCGGYAFFGVEFGAQCFCGASLGVAANTRPTSDTHCNYTCCADRKISCGGAEFINVYEAIDSSPSQSVITTSPSPTPASSAGSGKQSNGLNQDGNSNASNNIALGVGLGFGIPGLIIAAVTLVLKCSRRKNERGTDRATPTTPRQATQESSVNSVSELDSMMALQPQTSDGSA